MNAEGKRFALVVSRWNELVTKPLLEGAIDEVARFGGTVSDVVHVSGTWEIPPVAAKLLTGVDGPDAIIALGCILQGQTAHAQLLASDVGRALMDLQVAHLRPVSWGILTPDTLDQALDRAGGKLGNKGREAVSAAVESIAVLEQL